MKYPDSTRSKIPSAHVHAHVVQKRHEIAFLASRVRIENALLKGEARVDVTGDQTFPAVVADVLTYYRNNGWSGTHGNVEFEISRDGQKGFYIFESESVAFMQREPLIGRSVGAQFGAQDDSESSIGTVRGIGEGTTPIIETFVQDGVDEGE